MTKKIIDRPGADTYTTSRDHGHQEGALIVG